jgi:hypothetical protein
MTRAGIDGWGIDGWGNDSWRIDSWRIDKGAFPVRVKLAY